VPGARVRSHVVRLKVVVGAKDHKIPQCVFAHENISVDPVCFSIWIRFFTAMS
jgi:hypothetical protein